MTSLLDYISREHNIEPQETTFVKSVSEGSPAYYAGLSIGDRIVAVNGDTVYNKSYQDIIAAIKQRLVPTLYFNSYSTFSHKTG